MASARRRPHSRARWLAPLALLIAGVAVYSVVHRDPAGGTTPAATQSTAARTTAGTGRAARPAKKKRRTYTVKAGDTLSAIAGRTGVSLARIQELNPKLDSQTLQTGETIKLEP
jgi:N-acetylmuramoyl-L-alanine amidase